MIDKIKLLFTSIRFWIVTLGFISSVLVKIEAKDFTLGLLFEDIRNWLLVVAGIGTADSIATRLSSRQPDQLP